MPKAITLKTRHCTPENYTIRCERRMEVKFKDKICNETRLLWPFKQPQLLNRDH
jgi:hypothetical protein